MYVYGHMGIWVYIFFIYKLLKKNSQNSQNPLNQEMVRVQAWEQDSQNTPKSEKYSQNQIFPCLQRFNESILNGSDTAGGATKPAAAGSQIQSRSCVHWWALNTLHLRR